MQLIIQAGGVLQCVYSETLPLEAFGRLKIRRASHVEPTPDGRWTADLSPLGGPSLGPFDRRSTALAAEHTWLETCWLNVAESQRPLPELAESAESAESADTSGPASA